VCREFLAAATFLHIGLTESLPYRKKIAMQICMYIQEYGAKLVSLPEESWATSLCIWMGDHWTL
jgi:hypothetical protein